MKNEIDKANLDPDKDCESPDGMKRISRVADDYYDELWQEMLEIDKTFLDYHKEFEDVSKVINPNQATGIWFYSSIEAEEARLQIYYEG